MFRKCIHGIGHLAHTQNDDIITNFSHWEGFFNPTHKTSEPGNKCSQISLQTIKEVDPIIQSVRIPHSFQ